MSRTGGSPVRESVIQRASRALYGCAARYIVERAPRYIVERAARPFVNRI